MPARIKKPSMATTQWQEHTRQMDNSIGQFPGPQDAPRRVEGIVNAVHPNRPRLVKAHAADGTPLAGDKWITLNHSAQEIAERWGTVRIGFRIRATFTGPIGAGADASIIGTEGQTVEDPVIENEAAQGLYAVFCPGSGTS